MLKHYCVYENHRVAGISTGKCRHSITCGHLVCVEIALMLNVTSTCINVNNNE